MSTYFDRITLNEQTTIEKIITYLKSTPSSQPAQQSKPSLSSYLSRWYSLVGGTNANPILLGMAEPSKFHSRTLIEGKGISITTNNISIQQYKHICPNKFGRCTSVPSETTIRHENINPDFFKIVVLFGALYGFAGVEIPEQDRIKAESLRFALGLLPSGVSGFDSCQKAASIIKHFDTNRLTDEVIEFREEILYSSKPNPKSDILKRYVRLETACKKEVAEEMKRVK